VFFVHDLRAHILTHTHTRVILLDNAFLTRSFFPRRTTNYRSSEN